MSLASSAGRQFGKCACTVRIEVLACNRDGQIKDKPRFDAIYGVEGIVALSDTATAFLAANSVSPVVSGYGQPNGGVTYRLQDRSIFRLTPNDVLTTPSPRWDGPLWPHGAPRHPGSG